MLFFSFSPGCLIALLQNNPSINFFKSKGIELKLRLLCPLYFSQAYIHSTARSACYPRSGLSHSSVPFLSPFHFRSHSWIRYPDHTLPFNSILCIYYLRIHFLQIRFYLATSALGFLLVLSLHYQINKKEYKHIYVK